MKEKRPAVFSRRIESLPAYPLPGAPTVSLGDSFFSERVFAYALFFPYTLFFLL